MKVIGAIGIGGAIGTFSRYELTLILDHSFPYATILSNALGAFILGFLYLWLQSKVTSDTLKGFLTTGFCGSLTTFSAFSYEFVEMLSLGHIWLGFSYLVLSVTLGTIASLLGMYIHTILSKKQVKTHDMG